MKFTAIIIAAYLLMISFFPKGDYTQLARLVELGQHFRLHVREARTSHEEVSFQRFLQMHYFNTQMHQGNHEQDHEELPLHHITPSFDQIVPLVWIMAKLTPPDLQYQIPSSACPLRHSEYPASIFHPPIA